MNPILPRTTTLLCAALSVGGVVFSAVTEGLIISPVRTAVAFMSILLGVVFMVSIAPVFDNRRAPAPTPAVVASETPVQPATGSMHALLEQLYPDPAPETGTTVPIPAPTSERAQLRLVDADTGELVGDRVARLEERVTELTREVVDLGAVVQDQAELTAKAFGTLRREVERIGHVFPEPADA